MVLLRMPIRLRLYIRAPDNQVRPSTCPGVSYDRDLTESNPDLDVDSDSDSDAGSDDSMPSLWTVTDSSDSDSNAGFD